MARHKRRKSTARSAHEGASPDRDADHGPGDRLQKVLAASGVGSRRDCEEMIREGRVEIDRQTVTEMGTRVDPLRQEIRVDGQALRQPKRLYFAVNKPIGVVATNFDPSGRPRVIDLVPTEERVFAVGRLDRASEGLILVTNDGEFANRITHPRYGVEKTYLARVAGQPTSEDLARLKKGVYLSDGYCRVHSIVAKKRQGQSTDLVMILNEGRNREIRRVLARVGHKVLRLKRIAVGSIRLADQPVGAWRRLMPGEIESLLELAKQKRRASKTKKKSPHSAGGGMKPVPGERDQSRYLQQQALMAEPLSLADLLKDDLDDGGQMDGDAVAEGKALRGTADAAFDPRGEELNFSEQGEPAVRGGVIEYETDEPLPPQPAVSERPTIARTISEDVRPARGERPRRPGKNPVGKSRETKAKRPAENRYAKAGGKASPRPGGRKFAKPAGNKSARPTGGKFAKPTGEKFAKRGAKKSARPAGERPAKPAGKKFGKPGGKSFGKKFGKPGGDRNARR